MARRFSDLFQSASSACRLFLAAAINVERSTRASTNTSMIGSHPGCQDRSRVRAPIWMAESKVSPNRNAKPSRAPVSMLWARAIPIAMGMYIRKSTTPATDRYRSSWAVCANCSATRATARPPALNHNARREPTKRWIGSARKLSAKTPMAIGARVSEDMPCESRK